MMNLRARALLLSILLPLLTLSSAAAEFHGHPDLEKKLEQIKRISLLPLQINMFEIGAGGGLENMEEWSQTARDHVRRAIKEELAKRERLQLAEFDERNISGTTRAVYDETLLLYDASSEAIVTHSFLHPYVHPAIRALFFPWKARDFSYSLGKEIDVLASDVDAFFLIRGFDQRSSGGRKALGIGTALIGAALGVAVVPRGGGNLFTAALIDAHTGDILWFSKSIKAYDLREPEEATKLIHEFMADLPAIGLLSKP